MITSKRDQTVFLMLLTMAAGFTDCFFYLQSRVFPANMTGNSVVLAIAAAKGSFDGTATPALSILGFIIGSFTGAIVLDKKIPAPNEKKGIRQALYVETMVLIVAQALVTFHLIPDKLASVVLPSIAMGIQSVAINHMGVKGVSTITLTNTLTTAFNNLVYRREALRRAQPADAFNPALQMTTWIVFVSAAIFAALLHNQHFNQAMVFPIILLLGCIIFSHYLNRS